MALTAAQATDCRRFMGYGLLGDSASAKYSIPAFSHVGQAGAWLGISLPDRLASLQPAEESVLINTYLTPLTTIETAISTMGTNLGTNKAAVWERNQNELNDREQLFASLRRHLCAFMGFAPGPELGTAGTSRIYRC